MCFARSRFFRISEDYNLHFYRIQERLKSGTYDNYQSHNLKNYKGLMEPKTETHRPTKLRRTHVEMEYEGGERAGQDV